MLVGYLHQAPAQLLLQNKQSYYDAFDEINKMLNGQLPLDFKRAVFLTENSFFANSLDYKEFCSKINGIKVQLNQFLIDRNISNNLIGKQFAIFSYMMVSSSYNDNTKMTYDFEDIMGNKDWTKMFVTKLLRTKKGNCHSMPYLFKILAEELNAVAYLALAPNHLYIKHKDDKEQWVNLELTNNSFPRDSWIISSLAISNEAIKQEIYMEPLSLKQSVAITLLDLALGYQLSFGHDDFTLKCCDSVITNFPKSVNAYMIKCDILAEKRKRLIASIGNQRNSETVFIEGQIFDLMSRIKHMGYTDLTKAEYEKWLRDMEVEKNKNPSKN